MAAARAAGDSSAAGVAVRPSSRRAREVSAMSLLSLEHVSRTYDMGHVQVHALNDVSMSIDEGEFVAILGPSGSGKSTMMSIIGCLDRPSAGEYRLAGSPVGTLSDDRLAAI